MAEPIYAMMITGKDPRRLPLARMAIDSFRQQTYPNLKLVIVDDSPGDGFELELTELDVDRIRLPKGKTLGELRNLALDAIPYDAVWVQWDDDDWRHPECVAEQFKALGDAGAVALKSQVQHLVRLDQSWVVTRTRGIEGTVMARKNHVRYPAIPKAEDSVFRDRMMRCVEWRVWDNPPEMYVRLIHGANTWEEEHFLTRQSYRQLTYEQLGPHQVEDTVHKAF
jgi:glycosyltransferase involved in cell wall biosynthesis